MKSKIKTKVESSKSGAMTLEQVITFAILGILFLVVVGGLIKGIFIDKQISSVRAKTQLVTIDCDGDDVLGPVDHCPCVRSAVRLEVGKFCPQPDASMAGSKGTAELCPDLCKKK